MLRRLNRAALHELEKDTADKFVALNLDQTSRAFRNTSRGIHYQDGIERVDNTLVCIHDIPLAFSSYTASVFVIESAAKRTRNSSTDEIANVNYLYDDIVYTHYKIQ